MRRGIKTNPFGNDNGPKFLGLPEERIILGIDPGTTVMGFGVLRAHGKGLFLLEADSIRFPAEDDHTLKRAIFREVLHIIEKHHPDELAIRPSTEKTCRAC